MKNAFLLMFVCLSCYVQAVQFPIVEVGSFKEATESFRWLPSVQTLDVASITTNSAVGRGHIGSDGGSALTARGLCWSINPNPSLLDNYSDNGSEVGTFSHTMTELLPGTTYHFRAYGTNSEGTRYGDDLSFTTRSSVPEVTTSSVNGISPTSAICGGSVISEMGSPVTQKGVCWSINPSPSIDDAHTNDGEGLGSYTSSISPITPDTHYYVRAYAINGKGVSYGSEREFSTPLRLNNALDFNGTNNQVYTELTLPNQGTIEFWFYPNGQGGTLWSATLGVSTWYAELDNDNRIYTWIGTSGNAIIGPALTSNTWHHCAITWIKIGVSVTSYLYVNGNQAGYASRQWTAPNSVLTLGYRNSYYSGNMDEFRIWNTVRAQSQVRENMHIQAASPSSGLLIGYSFDHADGSIVSDLSGNNYHGILIGGTSGNWIFSAAPVGTYGNSIRITTPTVVGNTGNNVYVTITSTPDDNNYLGVYVSGTGSGTISAEIMPQDIVHREDTIWGVVNTGSVTSNLVFDYSEVSLAETDFPKLLKRANSISAWENYSAYAVLDKVNKTFTLTGITSFSEFTIGEGVGLDTLPGNCLSFDGIDDYANLGNNTAFDVGNVLTIEAWVKPNSLSTRQGIFSTRNENVAGSFQFEIGIGNNGTNRLAVTGIGTWVAQTGDNAVTEGEWNHVAYVRTGEGAGSHHLYVNGKEQTLISNSSYNFVNNSSNKVIASGSGGGQLFKGAIDEMRLWNVALTEEQLRSGMHNPIAAGDTGLVGYWQFNSSLGATAYERINGLNGTLVNSTDNAWIDSSIPFGVGFTESHIITDTGSTDYPSVSLSLVATTHSGSQTILVSKINAEPNIYPTGCTAVLDNQYWGFQKYGSIPLAASLIFSPSEQFAAFEASDPTSIRLYFRDSNSAGPWTLLASASEVNLAENTATFTNISQFGQYIITRGVAYSGTISQNTTWSGTVTITDHISILRDVRLTVEPGTIVEATGAFSIDCKGSVYAVGTLSEPILFTRAVGSDYGCNFVFNNVPATNDSTVFRYCTIEYGNSRDSGGGAMRFSGTSTSFDKYDVRNCTIRNNQTTGCGGGILIDRKPGMIFSNNEIISNTSSAGGGGLYYGCGYDTLTTYLDNLTVTGNYTGNGMGGGILVYFSMNGVYKEVFIRNSEIAFNEACFGGYAGHGGGICIYREGYGAWRGIIENCNIHNNTADRMGGGVYGGSMQITECNISENVSGWDGGGLCMYSYDNPSHNRTWKTSNSTIIGNQARNGGGIYKLFNPLENTIVSNNIATTDGGGIWGANGDLKHNVITGNQASNNGGGVYRTGDNNIFNNTIADNSAGNLGGGIYHEGDEDPNIINTILSGNSAINGGGQVWIEDNESDPDYICVILQDGIAGIGGDGSGTAHQGSVQNIVISAPTFVASGDHPYQLQSTSPGVNGGLQDSSALNLPALCPDGLPRIVDEPMHRMDIGAYEYQGPFETYYSYDDIILQDMTWHYSDTRLMTNLVVPQGVILTIPEGSTIQAENNCKITVNGTLVALGTETSPITFTARDTTGFCNDTHVGWGGITIDRSGSSGEQLMSYCTLEYAKSTSDGGAMRIIQSDSAKFRNCQFVFNRAYKGAGIYMYNSAGVEISDCLFENNASTNAGGAIFVLDSNVEASTIQRSRFRNNSASGLNADGGALKLHGQAWINLFNCLLDHNNATRFGGAIQTHSSSETKIYNCVIADNTAETSGGGVYVGGGIMDMRNSIIYFNTAPSYPQYYSNFQGSNPEYAKYYNNNLQGYHEDMITGVKQVKGNLYADPHFSRSGENPYSVTETSTCIDAGTANSDDLGIGTVDLAGNNRIFNGEIDRIDIGAYEYQGDPDISENYLLSFDGVDDYINVGNDSAHNLGSEFTIEAWIKPVHLNGRQVIYSSRKNLSPGSFQIEVGVGSGGTNRLGVYGAENWIAQSVDNVLNPGVWNHIAYVHPVSSTGENRLYVNGNAVNLLTSVEFNCIANTADKLLGSANGSTMFYNGLIDELRVWGEGLSQTQIRERMHHPSGGEAPNLKVYWKLDDAYGYAARDYIGDCHGLMNNIAAEAWQAATLPFGEGVSCIANEAIGVVNFGTTGVKLDYSVHNNSAVVVSKLLCVPNIAPQDVITIFDSQYWVTRRVGEGAFLASLTLCLSEDLLPSDETEPGRFKLFSRTPFSEDEWMLVTEATSVNSDENTLTFNNITDLGQFIVATRGITDLEAPQNLFIELEANYLTLSWDEVEHAQNYIVEASDNPYYGYTDITTLGVFDRYSLTANPGFIGEITSNLHIQAVSGSRNRVHWTIVAPGNLRFYRVVASAE